MSKTSLKSQNSNNTLLWLKRGVWLYFYLLLFEGALRKWVLPGLSDALLVIRDPLAIILLFYAWKSNVLKINTYIKAMTAIGILSIITTFLTGHQNLFVTLYGARILLIQFPFIFAIGAILNKNDVLQIGKHMLWMALPMTILITLQFYSPQSAWVNRGVGGDIEGAGFSGAMGFFRPPSTFSFANGNVFFYHLLTCFTCIFWLNSKKVNKILLIISTLCIAIAIPISLTRTLLFSVIISVLFYLYAMYYRPMFLKKISIFLLSLFVIGFIISNLEFVGTASDAFSSRFESASESEGGLEGTLIDRYLGGFLSAISNSQNIPFFGYGMGMGTNAGSQLLTGDRTFLIAEEEWARTIGEMGLLLGLGAIIIRIIISLKFGFKSFKALKKYNVAPWMLLSFVLLTVPQGQWAQPTALGFAIFGIGLTIAALNEKSIK